MAKSLSARSISQKIIAAVSARPELNTAGVRALRRDYSRRLKTEPARLIIATATQLIEQCEFTLRFIAYELLHFHHEAAASLDATLLEQLGRGIDCWQAVDTFASYLSGPAWRERQVPDRMIHRWAKSPNRWWRRAALVSTVPLNNRSRGGHGDPKRTLAVCELLIDDRDDMVVKALSWSLRELAKRDPRPVQGFIRQQRARLAPRILREVVNKLTTGLKNP